MVNDTINLHDACGKTIENEITTAVYAACSWVQVIPAMPDEGLRSQTLDLVVDAIEDDRGTTRAVDGDVVPGGREIRAAALGVTQRRHGLTPSVSNGHGRGA